MTKLNLKATEETEELTPGQILGKRITGTIRGVPYFRGVRWFGATNRIGKKPYRLEGEGPGFGYYAK